MTNKPAIITESQWDEALRDAHRHLYKSEHLSHAEHDRQNTWMLNFHGHAIWVDAIDTVTGENEALTNDTRQQALDKAREYLAVAPENRSEIFYDWQIENFGRIGWEDALNQAKQEQERARGRADYFHQRAEKIAGNLQKLAALIEQHPDNYLQVIEARVANSNDEWERADNDFDLVQFAADYDMQFRIKPQPSAFDKSREQFEHLYSIPHEIHWSTRESEYLPSDPTMRAMLDEARQYTTMLYCFHAGRQCKEDT